jgi:hypothetical protein
MARTRGTIVYPLAAAAYDVHTSDRYALGVNPNTGVTYLIHCEGVAYKVTLNKPWRFSDYSILAKWYGIKEVREMPVREGVDLADWIRTFGARLESNFMLARTALTKSTSEYVDDYPDVYRLLGEFVPNIVEVES